MTASGHFDNFLHQIDTLNQEATVIIEDVNGERRAVFPQEGQTYIDSLPEERKKMYI